MIVSLTANRFHNCIKSSENYTFYNDLRSKSGLADGVDVTGQVDHLVGEAPLVRGCLRRPRRVILYRNAQSSRPPPFPMPFRYQVFKPYVNFVVPARKQSFTSGSISQQTMNLVKIRKNYSSVKVLPYNVK